jgi:GNAT superfamily N-acetyltransferase
MEEDAMTEIAFAPADAADRKQIINLLHHYFSDHQLPATDDRIAVIVDGILGHPEHGFFHVARASSMVVGLACVHYNWTLEHYGKSAWLDDLFVRPDYRHRGVGKQLMLAAIERARRAGCHAIDFEVDEQNEWAGELARAEGFTVVDRDHWVLDLIRTRRQPPQAV